MDSLRNKTFYWKGKCLWRRRCETQLWWDSILLRLKSKPRSPDDQTSMISTSFYTHEHIWLHFISHMWNYILYIYVKYVLSYICKIKWSMKKGIKEHEYVSNLSVIVTILTILQMLTEFTLYSSSCCKILSHLAHTKPSSNKEYYLRYQDAEIRILSNLLQTNNI